MVKVKDDCKILKESHNKILKAMNKLDTNVDLLVSEINYKVNQLNTQIRRLTAKIEKLEKNLNKKVVAKTNAVESDMRAAKGTLYQDTIDWVKKFNINVPTFKKYYTTHTNLETGLYFGIDRRYTSKVAKQLGIAKRKFVKRNHK